MKPRLAALLTALAALVIAPIAGANGEIAVYRSHTDRLSVLVRIDGDHLRFSKVVVRLPCIDGDGTTDDVYSYFGRPRIQIDPETGRFRSRNYFSDGGRMRGRVTPEFIGGRFLGSQNPRLGLCPTSEEDRTRWLQFRALRAP